jgi:hypothetical protein
MAVKGPWLLALALELLERRVSDEEAVLMLLGAAQGSRDVLRGAYARALALSGELPTDDQAHRMVVLLSRAMRRATTPS